MHKNDLEHKLLSGVPIYVNSIPTYSITLEDMAEIGFIKVQNLISLICMDDISVEKYFVKDIGIEKSTFILLYLIIANEVEQFKNDDFDGYEDMLYPTVIQYLSKLFHYDVSFDINKGFKISDNIYMSQKFFSELQKVLKYRNCLDDKNNEYNDDNPDSEMTRRNLERLKELRKKIKKKKQEQLLGDEDGLTMVDLISIFAEAEHLAVGYVYKNYDIYQFNNQFNRLKIMNDFQTNIQLLCAGGGNDIKLQHWISKIENKND